MSVNTFQNAPVNEQTFTQFLFHNRRNRMILSGATAAIIIQFALFKYLYPFASFIYGDSFAYLESANQNLTINKYLTGYSKFIRLVSVFAKPDWVLVTIQYVMIQGSALFLLFTIFYFYKTGRITQIILLCFTVFNPLFLHLGNMVSSDGVFLALSTTWFALLLWILNKPSYTIVWWHAVVLFAAFTLRYNALIYPFISALAFGLSNLSIRKKVSGLGMGVLLIGWFVGLSMFQYKKLTGHWQYSPFSGWQLANNAMGIYREVDSANREPVPLKFRTLDIMVRQYFDTDHVPVERASTVFMWEPKLPLMRYNNRLFNIKDISEPPFKAWAHMGPFYRSYGWHIIKKYPWHFLRYFVVPNSLNYLTPPVEYLEYYNGGYPVVPESAVKWFGYTNNRVKTRMKSGRAWILPYYPFLVSVTNLIMLLMLLSYLSLKGWQYNPSFNKSILLAGFAWIANAAFTILAAFVALRFQAFPLLLSATFSLLLIDWMARLIQHLKRQQQQPAREYAQQVQDDDNGVAGVVSQ
jgi:hypothetical protein